LISSARDDIECSYDLREIHYFLYVYHKQTMFKDVIFTVFIVLVMCPESEFSWRTSCYCDFLLIVSRSWRLEFVLLSSPQLEDIVAILDDECVWEFSFSYWISQFCEPIQAPSFISLPEILSVAVFFMLIVGFCFA